MIEPEGRLFQDFSRLNVKNWNSMLAAAKLTRALYAGMRDLALHTLSSSEDEDVGAQAAAQYEAAKQLCDAVNYIYLGARAAVLEKKDGSFNDPAQLLVRMTEAFKSGALIQYFVDAALTMTADELLPEGQRVDTTSFRNRIAREVFEQVQDMATTHGINLRNLEMKGDTVIKVVKQEIGRLPSPVAETLRTVLTFRLQL
jgi:hypothetical protein